MSAHWYPPSFHSSRSSVRREGRELCKEGGKGALEGGREGSSVSRSSGRRELWKEGGKGALRSSVRKEGRELWKEGGKELWKEGGKGALEGGGGGAGAFPLSF